MLASLVPRPSRLAALIAASFVVAAPAAAAVPTPGNWSGTLHGDPLTFTVASDSASLHDFTINSFSVFCQSAVGGPGSGDLETKTFYLPSAPIAADGSFSATYQTTDTQGRPDGSVSIDGSFSSATEVSGEAHYNRPPCYGNESWTATGPSPSPSGGGGGGTGGGGTGGGGTGGGGTGGGDTGGGAGGSTAQPHATPFASHCSKRAGRRVCTKPTPLKHHTYRGTTSQQQAVAIGIDKKGRGVTFASSGLQFTCSDGTTTSEDVAIVKADGQHVNSRAAFSTELDYQPADGWTDEKVYVVGAFDRRKAKGKLVGNAQIAGHGACTTGVVTWSATG